MILVDLCWLDLIQDSKTSKERFIDEGERRKKVEERGERWRREEGGKKGGRKEDRYMGFK